MAQQHRLQSAPAAATPSDLVAAVSVQLSDNSTVDRQNMIDSLFSSSPEWTGRDEVRYQGDSFTVIRGADRAKGRLLSMFGAGRSLQEVDASIASLVEADCGWLAGQSDDTIKITSGELNANLEAICSLVMGSLSADIIEKVRSLIQSIHSILSGDSYFASTRQIDVSLFQKNQAELLCVHTRYTAETHKRGIKVFFFGGSKRSIQISFSLRKIGIGAHFWQSLGVADSTSTPYIVSRGLVSRSPMPSPSLPEQERLSPSRSDPTSSPNATRSRRAPLAHTTYGSSGTPYLTSRLVPLTPAPTPTTQSRRVPHSTQPGGAGVLAAPLPELL